MLLLPTFLLLAPSLASSPFHSAGGLQGLLGLGDTIPNGTVIELNALGVDDQGNWSARLRFLDELGGAHHGIMRNGKLLLTRRRTGTNPQSVFSSSFVSVGLRDDRVVSFGGVTSVSGPAMFRNGICFDATPAVLTTDSPGEPFSLQALYTDVFSNLRANDAGDVLATNWVWDGSFSGEVLQSFHFEGDSLVAQKTLDQSGPFLAGAIDLNARGQAVWARGDSFGGGADEIVLDGAVFASAGDPIPGSGRGATTDTGQVWSHFTGADLSEAGGVVLRGFSATDGFVATGERLVAASGTSPAAIAPGRFTFFGDDVFFASLQRELRPRLLADGSVVFYGDVLDEGTGASWAGLFHEDELLVATGDVVRGLSAAPDGASITLFGTQSGGFAVSPNGRFVLFDAVLDDDPQAALCLLDRGVAAARRGSHGRSDAMSLPRAAVRR